MDSLLRAQFGERLKQVLAARGLKSADLARLTGESAAKVAGWLQGKGLMVAGLAQIAVALDASLDWLVHGVGSEMAPETVDLSPMEEQLLVTLRHYGKSASHHLLGLLQSIELAGVSASLQQLRAKTLLADLELPSVILCHHGNLLVANEAFAHLLGLECDALDALVGQSYKKWLPHRLRSEFAVLLEGALTKMYTSVNSLTMPSSKNNEILYFNLRCRLFSNKDTSGVQFIFFKIKG